MRIARQYIVNEQDRRTAVLLDIETFEKMEEVIENYALYRLMEEKGEDDEVLESDDALEYYKTLVKDQ
ncbi:MAG: hypothetical protein Q3M24_05695 [Candidatus Electrothrix aestuarii]|uniref:Antitoxin n=1 Tax=Candidatus Electrothrix aestuarii TaxID=3062594 RepID=A0AAU8LXF4_9BACT|nr:hypothetical protein [Candidatus Electrothrix aestuarii]